MIVRGETVDPFLERLETHAQTARDRAPESASAALSPQVASERSLLESIQRRDDQLAFWQSPVARAAVNRRVTGDPGLAPEAYLAARHGPAMPVPYALSLRAGDARLETALVQGGWCEHVTGLDLDQQRVQGANLAVPAALRAQVSFRHGDLAAWVPPEPLGAVIARSVLHRQAQLEETLDHVLAMLAPGGVVFVDEFVGPACFQWTDAQLRAINRLLACLPDEFLLDLSAEDGRRKRDVGRPDPADYTESNPTDAVRSDEILACLDERFERVEVHLYGGALYHQFFTRIMGNFASRPELVSLVMEVDAMLTDAGVLSSDYVWGVWRRPLEGP
jgi:SAM-dependent methyltransferase